ncbi:DUF7287 family protein [Natronorubrum halophilum]|uniref:DUF7287 family protein n=1 Tax=Natronorubrum halophilum TaxID=1702106 RepID=UPI000EF736EC|nr:hypothetical protein [Natronorubrum halophilum]
MAREQHRHGRGRRRRTVSISLRERGQTTHDFVVGIGVFILAVAFVFSFLPTILTPFDSSVSGGQTAQADRIADRLVHNLSTDQGPNTFNESDFGSVADDDLDDLVGLRTVGDQVNVSIEHLNESGPVDDELTVGVEYNNQSAASSARIVTFEGDGPDGEERSAYRLVVRVW